MSSMKNIGKRYGNRILAWWMILVMLIFCCQICAVAETADDVTEGGEWEIPPMDEADLKILDEGKSAEGNEGTVEILDPADLENLLDEESSEEPWIPEDAEKAVFGADNRITVRNPSAYPYRAIAYMSVYASCGHSWTGSGFMISKNCLATAAHCVVCPKCSKWAKSITFYFGYQNSKNTYYTYNGSWYAWAGDLFPGKQYRINADYAIIRLNSDVGNRTGWFGIKWNANPSGKKLYVAGYKGGVLRYASGTAALNGSNHLKYTIDAVAGNSGGPVYDASYYTYGIHIAENSVYNTAYRMNTYVNNAWKKVK